MHSLKGRFTIVIVTHNMQQAARVADQTAFFSLDSERRRTGRHPGRVRRHRDDLLQPGRPADARLRHRPLRLAAEPGALSGAGSRRSETCWSSGCPHCQQKVAPLLWGAPQDEQEPAVADLLHPHQPFDLVQFGVGVLELRGALDQDLDLHVVADRHLVGEAAQVPLQLGDPGDQLVAPALAGRRRMSWPGRRSGRGRARARWPGRRRGCRRGTMPCGRSPQPAHSSPKKLPVEFAASLQPATSLSHLSADFPRRRRQLHAGSGVQDFFGALGFRLLRRLFDDLFSWICPWRRRSAWRCDVGVAEAVASPPPPLDHDRRRRWPWRRAVVAGAADQDADAERQQQRADAGDQRGVGGDPRLRLRSAGRARSRRAVSSRP